MKCFRNKRDGKLYGEIDGRFFQLYDFDSDEVVEVGGKAHAQHVHGVVNTYNDTRSIINADYRLKDVLTIPIGERNVDFVVEHIQEVEGGRNIYFVAKEIYCKGTMNDIEDTLREIREKMPPEFVDELRDIKHKSKNGHELNSKVNILSMANIGKEGYDYGQDDIPFDGLLTEAERCKNYKGETDWYWLSSPNLSSSANFNSVSNSGFAGYSNTASSVYGVVPSFSFFNPNKQDND